ncbi:DNA (cytosine-5)-methyltransferase 3B, partial [Stegodyphus mimosarum]
MEEYVKKRPLKVLSLFDGISTGKLALDSLGIGISKYYASEIDEEAIAISKLNHKDNIIHLGDVKNLCEEKLKCMCPIDLVIGGSPCNDLSLVNP